MLCAGHHDAIDNGVRYEGLRLQDGIDVQANGRRVYIIWNRDDGPESLDPLVQILLEVGDGDDAGDSDSAVGVGGDVDDSGRGSGDSQEAGAPSRHAPNHRLPLRRGRGAVPPVEDSDTEGGGQTNLVNDEGDALAGTSTPPSMPGASE